jgi:hypothetical protein
MTDKVEPDLGLLIPLVFANAIRSQRLIKDTTAGIHESTIITAANCYDLRRIPTEKFSLKRKYSNNPNDLRQAGDGERRETLASCLF